MASSSSPLRFSVFAYECLAAGFMASGPVKTPRLELRTQLRGGTEQLAANPGHWRDMQRKGCEAREGASVIRGLNRGSGVPCPYAPATCHLFVFPGVPSGATALGVEEDGSCLVAES
jgi:hypothetical protein